MKILAIFCIVLLSWRVSAYVINNEEIDSDEFFEFLSSNDLDIEDLSIANRIMDLLEQFRGNINDAVKDLIESQRHIIKTGVPPNIPPLDPLYIEEFLIEPDELTGFNTFEMTLEDSLLKGLYDFKIEEVDIRPLILSAVISISFEKLEMEGNHTTQATLLNGIFPIPVEGSGPYTLTLNNFRTSLLIQLEFNEQRRPNIKTMILTYTTQSATTNFSGFGTLTGLFNTIFSAAFPAFIALSNVDTNLRITQEIVPAINEIINEITLLDIIAIIRNLIRNNSINLDSEVMTLLNLYDPIYNDL